MNMNHDFDARAAVASIQRHHNEMSAAVTALCDFRMPGGYSPFHSPSDAIRTILDQIHALSVLAQTAFEDAEAAGEKSELRALSPDIIHQSILSVSTLSALASFFAHHGVEDAKLA